MTDSTNFFDNVAGGSGAPTPVLKNVGDVVSGEIVEMFTRDYVPFGKTDPEPDESEADGKRKQLVIIIQTEHRNWANVVKVPKVDPTDPNSAEKAPSEDDGKRAIYVPNRSNIQYAIGRALTQAKAKFEVGGTLAVRIANLKDTGKGNPLKEHEARYVAKAPGDAFFGGAQQAAPAAQAPAAAAPAPAAAPAAPAPQAPATPPAQSAPAADPWASTPAPAAPAGDPWATSSTPTEQPPF